MRMKFSYFFGINRVFVIGFVKRQLFTWCYVYGSLTHFFRSQNLHLRETFGLVVSRCKSSQGLNKMYYPTWDPPAQYSAIYQLDNWAATWQNQQSYCVPSEDSDQTGHPPSLISVFAVRMKKAWVLNYPLSARRRLWSDLADAQADLSLRWAHSHFVGFVMPRLNLFCRALQLMQPLLEQLL